MTIFLIWLACSLLAGFAIIVTEMWDYHHPKPGVKPIKVTSKDILVGVITALCPLFNVLVFMVGVIYFFTRIIPELKE
jgi:hypothetical protein